MTWTKLDDGCMRHPKLLHLSRSERLFWIEALCWCNEQLTNGVIPAAAVVRIAPDLGPAQRSHHVRAMLASGLWDLGHEPDTWLVHDFLSSNPSRDTVLAKRSKEAERKQRIRTLRHDVPGGTPSGTPLAQNRTDGRAPCSTKNTDLVALPARPGPTRTDPDPDLLSASVPPADPATRSAAALHGIPTEPGEPKPKRKRKPKSEPQAEPEGYRAVVDAYFVAFAAARGGQKPMFGARDGNSTKRLIEAAGSWERAREVIASVYADAWLSQRVSINDIAADPSKFVGRASPQLPRRDVQRSPAGHLDRVLAEQRAEGQRRAALAPADCFALTAEELQS